MEEQFATKDRSLLQSGLAVAFPISTWKGPVLELTWMVRWTAAGLTPTKLVVTFSRTIQVKAGQAALISGSFG